MFRTFLLFVFVYISSSTITNAQNKIGIGTNNPQQMLSVFHSINVDQSNTNGTGLLNGIFFGSNSTVGIASNRTNDYNSTPINNLMFFTNNQNRLTINREGKIMIGGGAEYAKVNIKKESRYDYTDFQNASALLLSGEANSNNEYVLMGSDNTNHLSFINAERIAPYVNTGSTLLLQARGRLAVGAITNPSEKMEVDGNVRLTGSLIVKGNNGIIRNNNATQSAKQIATVTVSGNFAAGETRQFDVVWPVAFASSPDGYIGNVISGSGGWAECVMSLALLSSSGGKLYVFNPRNITFAPSFTVNILAFGPVN